MKSYLILLVIFLCALSYGRQKKYYSVSPSPESLVSLIEDLKTHRKKMMAQWGNSSEKEKRKITKTVNELSRLIELREAELGKIQGTLPKTSATPPNQEASLSALRLLAQADQWEGLCEKAKEGASKKEVYFNDAALVVGREKLGYAVGEIKSVLALNKIYSDMEEASKSPCSNMVKEIQKRLELATTQLRTELAEAEKICQVPNSRAHTSSEKPPGPAPSDH